MKFEIGNPSDLCFLEADDPRIAAACILFLGNGHYFCINTETREQIDGTFFVLGGDVDETWKEYHGVSFNDFMELPNTKSKMKACFESFSYANERSSINNIGKMAEEFAKSIIGTNAKTD